jgi:glucosylceramidase
MRHYRTSKYTNEFISLVKEDTKDSQFNIVIDDSKTYQKMIGFGGAFTEAAAYTLYQMPKEKQEILLKAYFDPKEGLGYNLGRVSIHSCDFSLENYTYVEDNDKSLSSFDISRDFKYVIPMIKRAEAYLGDKISFLGSPWSPPAWMKTNNEMNNGGKLLPDYFDAWANYYIKFVDKYKEAGINIDYLSVQNEPAAVQVWDSCIYTAEEERDFVKNHLGPKLEASYPEINLVIWDHNRDIIVDRADTVLKDEEARKYVWGTGLHWYVSEEFENVGKVHELHPDKHILFTEGCIEGGVHLNDWTTGERYARNMIGDFNNYCEGYIDWNLTLNEIGGPNHVGNYCDAPIISDTVNKELHFNSSYYYIGHFSKFVKPGAVRIGYQCDDQDLKVVAFKNPTNELVLIVLNETELEKNIGITMNGKKQNVHISKRSISTITKEV